MTDQKHYPMPELSEQERSLLIEQALHMFSILDKNGKNAPIYQIALAALTAPKPEIADYQYQNRSGDWKKISHKTAAYAKSLGFKIRETYTAPPVLTDLLPDLYDIPDGHDLTSCMAGAAWYEQQLKRRLTLIESGKWKIVPVEPTPEMMLHNSGCHHHAWDDADCSMRKTRRLIWGHMLSAAPEAPC